jgi:hypothetical protein
LSLVVVEVLVVLLTLEAEVVEVLVVTDTLQVKLLTLAQATQSQSALVELAQRRRRSQLGATKPLALIQSLAQSLPLVEVELEISKHRP